MLATNNFGIDNAEPLDYAINLLIDFHVPIVCLISDHFFFLNLINFITVGEEYK
jgi:hypothetical protein